MILYFVFNHFRRSLFYHSCILRALMRIISNAYIRGGRYIPELSLLFIFSEQTNNSSTPSRQNTSILRSCANHAVCLKWHATPLAQIPKTVDREHAPCELVSIVNTLRVN